MEIIQFNARNNHIIGGFEPRIEMVPEPKEVTAKIKGQTVAAEEIDLIG